jgi:TIR domain
MFDCSASTRNLSLRPVELGSGELIFTYPRADQDVLATKPEFNRELAQIKESLEWLRQDCRGFNATVPALIRDLVVARRTRLMEMTQGIRDLGVPIRTAAASVPASARTVAAARHNARAKKPDHYDIALSFAGENRPYVEEVADELKAAGVSVFYDKFETANLWGKNLIEHLAEIYANSRFVVMFVSKEYVEKAWTTHERRHAQERALFAQDEYILPARFDDTAVPGMTNTVAFQDLRCTTPRQLVELILAKLGRR